MTVYNAQDISPTPKQVAFLYFQSPLIAARHTRELFFERVCFFVQRASLL